MGRRPDQEYRKWLIVCRRGSFRTLSMQRHDAIYVAEWCDSHHDCGPHTVASREKRTWAGRRKVAQGA